VNTIKKFRILLIFVILFYSNSLAFTPEYEKEIYIGCYANSKQYLGADKAKNYCLCTINKLSDKYSEAEMNLIFKKKPEEIIKATEFAAIHCENI
jgi:hypothetical protein